jgi:PBP1b-binding outer membrane lipoprotein LpoB
MMKNMRIITIILSVAFLAGCATSGGHAGMTRGDPVSEYVPQPNPF